MSNDDRPSLRDPRRVLLALVVIGAALRFAAIGRQSFWYDESVSALLAKAPLGEIFGGVSKDLGNPPLHLILLHLWGALFGDGDVALRSLSAICGVAAIPLVFSIGRRLVGPTAALVAAAILAASPVHLYFAQEARTYTLVTTLALLSLDMFLRGVEQPKRAWPWLIHGLVTFLAIYAHYYAFFVILAQFVVVLVDHRKDRALLGRFFASLTGAALLYLTWLPSFYAQVTTKGNLARAAETWHLHLISTPLVFSVGTTLVWKDSATPFRLGAAGLATIAFAIPALVGARALLRENRPALRLLALWLLLPIALPLLVSALLFPFYYVRYGLLASPAWYLFIAVGLVRLARPARAAIASTMAATAALSLFFYFTTLVKHDWRDVAAYVEPNLQSGDLIAFDADIGETPYGRYGKVEGQRVRLVPPIVGAPRDRFYGTTPALGDVQDLTARLADSARVWLVFSDPKLGSGDHYRRLLDEGWRFVSERRFRGVEVRLYERSRPQPPEGSPTLPAVVREAPGGAR